MPAPGGDDIQVIGRHQQGEDDLAAHGEHHQRQQAAKLLAPQFRPDHRADLRADNRTDQQQYRKEDIDRLVQGRLQEGCVRRYEDELEQ